MPQATNAEIARLIEEVNGAGRHNQWDVESLRHCAREFLADLTEEAARFPETLAKAQWDLFAADDNHTEHVAFIVVLVSPERVAMIAGRGPWEAVRDHGENFRGRDAFDVLSTTKVLFPATVGPVEISRAAFDEWVGSPEHEPPRSAGLQG